MKDFLTVKEFAELANKKPQTIYKQLEKRLKPYVRIHKGQKMISVDALKDFYGVEQPFQPDSTGIQLKPTVNQLDPNQIKPDFTVDEQPFQPNSTAAVQPDSTNEKDEKAKPDKDNDQIEALNKLIDIIQKQLEEKDKQLAVKDKQIQDLSDRLAEAMQLTRGQQYITAADKTTELLEADNKRGQQEERPIVVNEAAIKNTAAYTDNKEKRVIEKPEQPQKKSFWQRLLGR